MKISITRTVTFEVDFHGASSANPETLETAASKILGDAIDNIPRLSMAEHLKERTGYRVTRAKLIYSEPYYRVFYSTLSGYESWDILYATLDDARNAITEHLEDSKDLSDSPSPDDFYIFGNGTYYDYMGSKL